MAWIIGSNSHTEFSWIEYQALMLCLAGVICAALVFIELALSRFQVLPLLFPGMFSVRERRFFFFNFDISDGNIGKAVRSEAKLVVRMTICLVLSYLWQHCVLETTQQVGKEFPTVQCERGADCFASELHFTTLFSRDYEAIDCKGGHKDFALQTVVSCIRFVPPSATTWLMHLAISNSVTQLNFKSFELLVWIGGNSKWSRRLLGSLIVVSFGSFIVLFFAGVMSEFVSSWLSFVMSLTIPLFLHTVYRSAKHLQRLWQEEAMKVQQNIEEHLSGAFADIEDAINLENEDIAALVTGNGTKVDLESIKARENSKQEGKVIAKLKNTASGVFAGARARIPKLKSNPAGKAPSPPKQETAPVIGNSSGPGSGSEDEDKAWLSPGLGAALEAERNRSN